MSYPFPAVSQLSSIYDDDLTTPGFSDNEEYVFPNITVDYNQPIKHYTTMDKSPDYFILNIAYNQKTQKLRKRRQIHKLGRLRKIKGNAKKLASVQKVIEAELATIWQDTSNVNTLEKLKLRDLILVKKPDTSDKLDLVLQSEELFEIGSLSDSEAFRYRLANSIKMALIGANSSSMSNFFNNMVRLLDQKLYYPEDFVVLLVKYQGLALNLSYIKQKLATANGQSDDLLSSLYGDDVETETDCEQGDTELEFQVIERFMA